MTNFSNDYQTGSVIADTVASKGRLFLNPVVMKAAGATQGSATLIGNVAVVVVTATLSAQGLKLPVATTNRVIFVGPTGTKAPKLYPNTNGRIGTAATNVAVQLTANTGVRYVAINTTQWIAI